VDKYIQQQQQQQDEEKEGFTGLCSLKHFQLIIMIINEKV
jgi:hypothetical protein